MTNQLPAQRPDGGAAIDWTARAERQQRQRQGIFHRGDLVRHTGKFLRSIQWHTGVPINGVVVGLVAGRQGSVRFLDVAWSDGNRGAILVCNVESFRGQTVSETLVASLESDHAETETLTEDGDRS